MSDPRIWSDSFWGTFHRGAFAYPEKPTDEDKQKARDFFHGASVMLPCPMCQQHYKQYLKENFNDSVLESSDTLQRFVYNMHCAINNRLKVPNTVRFEDLRKMYNSFPTRYVDMDTGKVLLRPRFYYNYGVSQPADAEAREWLVQNNGLALNDRNILAQIFTPIGEKQERCSRFLALALAFILTIVVTVFLTNVYNQRKREEKTENLVILSPSVTPLESTGREQTQ